jgi:alginate O-acetyltransferase complex protein AlgI
MIFTELRFFLFLGLVLALHWSLRGLRARKLLLLVGSYFFYGCWDWRFLFLILLSTVVDYLAALRIAATPGTPARRAWLALSVLTNLGILSTFKYLGFFVESAQAFLAWLGFQTTLPTLSLVLPVGISFYTFQTMSYTLDVYFGRLEARRSFLDLALFVSFFPQLVAGPIVRAREFLPQLDSPRRFPHAELRPLLLLFLAGYFKKACVADPVAPLIERYFADPGSYDLATAWQAILYFLVQMYCDFSGYSDMAIASAGLLGYRLAPNFDFPLLATSVQAFWRRWHMSLFSWFRDYVYFPLGGNRYGEARSLLNLLVTTGLVGLWHGAAWHFVLWGLFIGMLVIASRFLAPLLRWDRWPGLLSGGLGMVLTYVSVSLSVVLFRAVDLAHAGRIYAACLTGRGLGPRSYGNGPWLVFAALILLHALFWTRIPQRWVERAPSWVLCAALGGALPVVFVLTSTVVVPFQYFQF